MKTATKARTLTAILPNGAKVARKTVHRYEYVVAAAHKGMSDWGALSWHLSYDNAMVQLNSRWAQIYDLRIVTIPENAGSVYCTF